MFDKMFLLKKNLLIFVFVTLIILITLNSHVIDNENSLRLLNILKINVFDKNIN